MRGQRLYNKCVHFGEIFRIFEKILKSYLWHLGFLGACKNFNWWIFWKFLGWIFRRILTKTPVRIFFLINVKTHNYPLFNNISNTLFLEAFPNILKQLFVLFSFNYCLWFVATSSTKKADNNRVWIRKRAITLLTMIPSKWMHLIRLEKSKMW